MFLKQAKYSQLSAGLFLPSVSQCNIKLLVESNGLCSVFIYQQNTDCPFLYSVMGHRLSIYVKF